MLEISFEKVHLSELSKTLLFICGFPITLFFYIGFLFYEKNVEYFKAKEITKNKLIFWGQKEKIETEILPQLYKKIKFFGKNFDDKKFEKHAEILIQKRFDEIVEVDLEKNNKTYTTFESYFFEKLKNKLFFAIFVVFGFFGFLILLLNTNLKNNLYILKKLFFLRLLPVYIIFYNIYYNLVFIYKYKADLNIIFLVFLDILFIKIYIQTINIILENNKYNLTYKKVLTFISIFVFLYFDILSKAIFGVILYFCFFCKYIFSNKKHIFKFKMQKYILKYKKIVSILVFFMLYLQIISFLKNIDIINLYISKLQYENNMLNFGFIVAFIFIINFIVENIVKIYDKDI